MYTCLPVYYCCIFELPFLFKGHDDIKKGSLQCTLSALFEVCFFSNFYIFRRLTKNNINFHN